MKIDNAVIHERMTKFDKLFGYGRCVVNIRINLIDPLSLAELAEINEKLSVMTTEA